MKKPQRPFTFEVKRSRLPSREPSALQRSVVEIERLSVNKPSDLAEVSPAGATETPCQPVRVLPDLSGERVWTEDLVTLPSQWSELIDNPGDLNEPADVLASAPARQIRSHVESPNLLRPSRRVKLGVRTVQDLPRWQRWKRHLPKAAW